ncbi:undecaprenyl-diphosphate phosphatase [Streptomyces tauricus]|nr:undecaprenyl-diphosphate phosphatase [Streptomyces tauricus]
MAPELTWFSSEEESSMNIFEAVFLGAVEGFTEFLPVSSTGHLTILERMLGYSTDDADITAFTAIIQVGAVLATLLYLRSDVRRLLTALFRGLTQREQRKHADYKLAWAVILGSLPIGVVGLAFKDTIETTLRTLWFVSAALVLWSAVMWYADRRGTQVRGENDVTWKDTLIIGIVQCMALIPGVSRSGATMSAGLLRGLDRVTVTRLSFMLSIPALTAAGALQTIDEFDAISNGVGWTATLTATAVSFVTAYLAVSWLLKFVAKHSYSVFIGYRVVLGLFIMFLLGADILPST